MGLAEALNEGKNEEKTDTCTGKLGSGRLLLDGEWQRPRGSARLVYTVNGVCGK